MSSGVTPRSIRDNARSTDCSERSQHVPSLKRTVSTRLLFGRVSLILKYWVGFISILLRQELGRDRHTLFLFCQCPCVSPQMPTEMFSRRRVVHSQIVLNKPLPETMHPFSSR